MSLLLTNSDLALSSRVNAYVGKMERLVKWSATGNSVLSHVPQQLHKKPAVELSDVASIIRLHLDKRYQPCIKLKLQTNAFLSKKS